MPKPLEYELSVVGAKQLTPNMKRITLAGVSLESFPSDQEGAYIKLMLPQGKDESPAMRTYTVSLQRPEIKEIDIDFVLHDHGGPASKWAQNVKLAETISIAGPGAKKLVEQNADWFFIVGDMTALPAICANLRILPPTARGYLVVEVIDSKDIQNLQIPVGIEMHWVVSSSASSIEKSLLEKVESLPWLDGTPYVWAACEFGTMRALRKYFKVNRQVDRNSLYISSYWKKGVDEKAHKKIKRDDSIQAEALGNSITSDQRKWHFVFRKVRKVLLG